MALGYRKNVHSDAVARADLPSPISCAGSGHPLLKAVLSRHARWPANSLGAALRLRVRAGHVYQAWIGRTRGARGIVCAGLPKQVSTANPAHDRQHPDSCEHCPLH